MQVIARIGKLKVLNGSIISAVERKECEVQYLRESAGDYSLYKFTHGC